MIEARLHIPGSVNQEDYVTVTRCEVKQCLSWIFLTRVSRNRLFGSRNQLELLCWRERWRLGQMLARM
jgi:hypothetical protein